MPLALYLIVGLTLITGSPATTDPLSANQMHPNAPAQTAQFAFLIGDWECAAESLTPDGKQSFSSRGFWSGRWVIGGWAIQDHWYSLGPAGVAGWGTNLRWWNQELGRWENQWLQNGASQLSHFYADQVGDEMVMIGGAGDSAFGPFIDRNSFYDIGEHSWRWRKDRSFDQGQSWVSEVSTMHCQRR